MEGAEGEDGAPAPVGFKHTVDEQLAVVSSWWGGAAEGEEGKVCITSFCTTLYTLWTVKYADKRSVWLVVL